MLNQPAALVDVRMRAMAHAGRRAMVRHALESERRSSELARIAGLSRPAATQHLGLLREAGLVTVRVDGRERWYQAEPAAFDVLRTELADFWTPRLDALRRAAEA